MDEATRHVVGIDVGTENVRAMVASVNKDGELAVVGFAEAANTGMRKGMVANLLGPAESMDRMLGEVERMSGYEVNTATVSINGAQILSTRTEGMIAMGAMDHEITGADLARVEDVAVVGRIPANREVLDVVPLEYNLDGQGGVKDPIGMTGSRLELRANVVSALTPNAENLKKATMGANVATERLVPAVVAAARAVLSERQMENGVAVIDLGAATTSVAIFEEGDLQYVGVVPVGSNNVTNDLAIMLEIDTAVAEDLKRRFVTGSFGERAKPIVVKIDGVEVEFSRETVDEVVQARLSEILERIQKKIREAKYEKRLPEGVVLTGGGAKMKDIQAFTKLTLGCSVKIGKLGGFGGVTDMANKPEFATAAGLMLMAADNAQQRPVAQKKKMPGGDFLGKIGKIWKKK